MKIFTKSWVCYQIDIKRLKRYIYVIFDVVCYKLYNYFVGCIILNSPLRCQQSLLKYTSAR